MVEKEVSVSGEAEIKEAGRVTRLRTKDKKTKIVEVEVEGRLREDIVTSDSTMIYEPQVMSERARNIRAVLKKQKRILSVQPPIGSEVTASVTIDGVVYESIGEPIDITINGYKYYVPRGVPVELPESIDNLLKDNKALYAAQRKLEEDKRKAIKRLYDNPNF